jgi:hypothetical protein
VSLLLQTAVTWSFTTAIIFQPDHISTVIIFQQCNCISIQTPWWSVVVTMPLQYI